MSLPRTLPRPRTPDPLEAPVLRWGILGTGWIAHQFAAALHEHTHQVVQAVGSRSAQSAGRAAASLGAATAHASYEALVNDPEVDIVYVATPHNHHHPNGLLALRAGKPVLIEKPIALNAGQARELAEVAAAAGLFCMEAFWTFFLPKYDVLRQLLEDGAIGQVRTVLADHGQYFEGDHRILRPDLAGGPMLDLMTYPAGFAHWILGAPNEVVARTTWMPSGVTGQTSIMMTTEAGQQALLHSSVEGPTPTTASVGGLQGSILIDSSFYTPGGFTVRGSDPADDELRYDEPQVAHSALFWQAAEAARRIGAGELGSPLRTLDASIATMEIMDDARHQIGEVYPEEQ